MARTEFYDTDAKDCGLCGGEIDTPHVLRQSPSEWLIVCGDCAKIIRKYEAWLEAK